MMVESGKPHIYCLQEADSESPCAGGILSKCGELRTWGAGGVSPSAGPGHSELGSPSSSRWMKEER